MSIARAAAIVAEMKAGVAFTGAGVSTESGIPDFRSPGGVWTKYDPEEFSFPSFVARAEARKKYWRWGLEFYPHLVAAKPNPGHDALAELERRGKLRCVITQNVDDLHRRAGSQDVIELHGNATTVACLTCGQAWPRDEIHARLVAGDEDPHCECGGLLKPRTISFGQPMPPAETRRAFAEARACDVMLVLGSSLVVYPAADLVPEAVEAGARVILINMQPTPYDEMAAVVLRGKVGEVLPRLLAETA
jgi:NAD-dependent deacetylase